MAWTTPTIRATGYLVTASDWNTDIVNNLAYLKGEAGVDIELEDDLVPSAGTERVGLSTNPWDEGHFDKLYAGPRYSLHRFTRRQCLPFIQQDFGTGASDYQMGQANNGNGGISRGGANQGVLDVQEDGAGDAEIYNETEQNSGQDTSFAATKSPYLKVEFALDRATSAYTNAFIGFRATKTSADTPVAGENFFGLYKAGASWFAACGDGTSVNTGSAASISNATRYVVEMLLISATQVEVYINGTLVDTLTANLPTGNLDWQIILESLATGGANVAHLTFADLEAQEDLS